MPDDLDTKENLPEPKIPVTQQLVSAALELVSDGEGVEGRFLDLLLEVNDHLMAERANRSPGWHDPDTLKDGLKTQLDTFKDPEKDMVALPIYLSDSVHRLYFELDRENPKESTVSLNTRDDTIDPGVLARWEDIKPELE